MHRPRWWRLYGAVNKGHSELVDCICLGINELLSKIPLTFLIHTQGQETVKQFVGHTHDVDKLCDGKFTVLHRACYAANAEIVNMLVEKGADAKMPDTWAAHHCTWSVWRM